jgi:hypothetical protein
MDHTNVLMLHFVETHFVLPIVVDVAVAVAVLENAVAFGNFANFDNIGNTVAESVVAGLAVAETTEQPVGVELGLFRLGVIPLAEHTAVLPCSRNFQQTGTK